MWVAAYTESLSSQMAGSLIYETQDVHFTLKYWCLYVENEWTEKGQQVFKNIHNIFSKIEKENS